MPTATNCDIGKGLVLPILEAELNRRTFSCSTRELVYTNIFNIHTFSATLNL